MATTAFRINVTERNLYFELVKKFDADGYDVNVPKHFGESATTSTPFCSVNVVVVDIQNKRVLGVSGYFRNSKHVADFELRNNINLQNAETIGFDVTSEEVESRVAFGLKTSIVVDTYELPTFGYKFATNVKRIEQPNSFPKPKPKIEVLNCIAI